MMRTMFRPWKRLLMLALGIDALLEQQAVTRREVSRLDEWRCDLGQRLDGLRREIARQSSTELQSLEDLRGQLADLPDQRKATLEIQRQLNHLVQQYAEDVPEWLASALPGEPR